MAYSLCHVIFPCRSGCTDPRQNASQTQLKQSAPLNPQHSSHRFVAGTAVHTRQQHNRSCTFNFLFFYLFDTALIPPTMRGEVRSHSYSSHCLRGIICGEGFPWLPKDSAQSNPRDDGIGFNFADFRMRIDLPPPHWPGRCSTW